jgi:hypothetical protein
VLVLDALDELRTWKVAPYLMRRLPEKLHIILTVRDVGQDWLADYELPQEQTQHLRLGGLEQNDVAEVLRVAGENTIRDSDEPKYSQGDAQRLRAAGERAIQLADDREFIAEIMRVAAYQKDERLCAGWPRMLQLETSRKRAFPSSLRAWTNTWIYGGKK